MSGGANKLRSGNGSEDGNSSSTIKEKEGPHEVSRGITVTHPIEKIHCEHGRGRKGKTAGEQISVSYPGCKSARGGSRGGGGGGCAKPNTAPFLLSVRRERSSKGALSEEALDLRIDEQYTPFEERMEEAAAVI